MVHHSEQESGVYRLVQVHSPARADPAPPRELVFDDAFSTAEEWFRHDTYEQPWIAQFRADRQEQWAQVPISWVVEEAGRAASQRDPGAVYALLARGGWLHRREIAALDRGLDSAAAAVQAFREWALVFSGLPPLNVVRDLDRLMMRAGGVPGFVDDARTAAGLAVIRAVTAADMLPPFDGQVGAPEAQEHRQHWLALAGCGTTAPAAGLAARYLSQTIRIDPLAAALTQILENAGGTPDEAELLVAISMTLLAAGRRRQSNQLFHDLTADPAAVIHTIRAPAAFVAAAQAQRDLATAAARLQATGRYDPATALHTQVAEHLGQLHRLAVVTEIRLPEENSGDLGIRLAALASRLRASVRARAAAVREEFRVPAPPAPRGLNDPRGLEDQQRSAGSPPGDGGQRPRL
jgi:hypothetical protein